MLPPVFILSCERSGSTLLRLLLDTHPDVAAPGELRLGELLDGLLLLYSRTLGQTEEFAAGGRRVPVEPWWCEEAIPASAAARLVVEEVRQLVDSVLERYARSGGKKVCCIKSPRDLPYARVLRLLWPQARFVCLYRNSLDVAHSCLETSLFGFMEELAPYAVASPRNTWSAMLSSWVEKTEQLLDLERRWEGRTCRVCYEDLVREPQATMARLLDFLELAAAPEMVTEVFRRPHHGGGGDHKIAQTTEILTDRIGRRRDFPKPVPALLLKRVNELHGELGYPRIMLV